MVAVLLKCFHNFWRTSEMALINYGIKLILIWSSTCVITDSTLQGELAITNTKLYDSIVTLSTQDNKS